MSCNRRTFSHRRGIGAHIWQNYVHLEDEDIQKPSVKQEERGSYLAKLCVLGRLIHQILTICEIGGGAGGKPRGSGGSGSLLCAGNPKAVVTLQKQI